MARNCADGSRLQHDVESEIALGDLGVNRERPPHHVVPAGSELWLRDLQQRGARRVHVLVLLVHSPAVTAQNLDRAERRFQLVRKPECYLRG
jgi:hypothetical protein